MTRFLVAVVNGAKARFLTLEPLNAPELESGPDLIERCDLVNPAFGMAGQDLWANTKTGRNRGGGGKGHNYDDHRDNHLEEFGRRFAQEIVTEVDRLLAEYQLNTLILVAEPQILGTLRDCLHSSNGRSVAIEELTKDLCWMKSRQLHDYLSQRNMLPTRQVALAAIRPRRATGA